MAGREAVRLRRTSHPIWISLPVRGCGGPSGYAGLAGTRNDERRRRLERLRVLRDMVRETDATSIALVHDADEAAAVRAVSSRALILVIPGVDVDWLR